MSVPIVANVFTLQCLLVYKLFSFNGEEKWVNLLRRINTSESSSYDTFLFNLKPSLSEKILVCRGAKVAPVHGLAEEVVFSISRSVVLPSNRK